MKKIILSLLLTISWSSSFLLAQESTPPNADFEPTATVADPIPALPAPPTAPLAPVQGTVATPEPGFPFGKSERGITVNIDSGEDSEESITKEITTHAGFDFQHVLVPIIAIIISFATPVLIVGLVLVYRMKKNRLLHQTIQTLVSSGQPIPPELFVATGAKTVPTPESDLRKGIILCMVGLGAIGFFLGVDGPWGLGFIPLAWGGGHLLTAKFAPRKSPHAPENL